MIHTKEMVQKPKKKISSGAKTKRWAKGRSCVSNPDVSKHRQNAKSKFFVTNRPGQAAKKSKLTIENMMIHDGVRSRKDSLSELMDDINMDDESTGTTLSGLSDCTNMTFSKLQQYWLRGSAKHKQACAIVAAITEVIRQQGAEESDTAYFAALATALETVDDIESVSAVVYLLSFICKRVNEAVLRAKFAEVSNSLMKVLMKYQKDRPTAATRCIMNCLGTLLRNLGYEEWSNSSTMNIYQTLLSHCFFTKPKIRKVAQNSVCAVLKASSFMQSDSPPDFHPAAPITAKYCVQLIEKSGAISDSNSSSTCHVVTLLGEILHCFPAQWLMTVCETILKLMMLSQPVVKMVSFRALHTMFQSRPSERKLTADLCGKIITSLYDYLPSSTDVQLLKPWFTLTIEALKHLVHLYSTTQRKVDVESVVLAHISAMLKTCLKVMESTAKGAAEAASSAAIDALECLKACEKFASPEKFKMSVSEAFNVVGRGLEFRYHSVRDLTLKLLETAYKHLAASGISNTISELLPSMANLRDTLSPFQRKSLDKALGAAVISLGPKAVLEAVPLLIEGSDDDDFHRSWMLPLLKNSVKNTEMAFFTSYFLPLAAKLQVKALQCKSSGNNSSAQIYDTLQFQIWSLLPNFCDGAKDVPTAFPVLARTLGSAISDKIDLRLISMQALRTLMTTCHADDDRNTLKRFAKNYLPILFNLYSTPPTENETSGNKKPLVDWSKSKAPDRLAALETIRIYLGLADQQTVCKYFSKAQERVFNSPNESDGTRLALLDIIVCMVPHVDEANLGTAYKDIKPMLKSPNPRMQKKAYRLLNEVLASSSPACLALVEKNMDEIKKILIDSLAAASQSSKGARLKCIESVLKSLGSSEKYSDDECVLFLTESIPEIILCTRDKKKVRAAAFSILVTAANTYREATIRVGGESSEKTALVEYFKICSVGLGGSVTAITATVCALSRLIYEFKKDVPSELLDENINKVCLLLGTNTRQIVKAALGFVNVLLSILDKATLAQHLPSILGALFEWKNENRRHFRFRVKKLLERLVKKFGYETIYSMVPENHKKQLANLKKTRDRQKRQQLERKQAKDEDSESDGLEKDDENIDALLADSDDEKEESGKDYGSSWLTESQEDPVNLMEQSSSRNIVATNPHKKGKRTKLDQPFTETSDGRMIINEDMDKNTEEKTTASASFDLKYEQWKRGADVDMEIDEEDDEPKIYKHGGSGIHRKIDVTDAKKEKGKKKTAKKDNHEPYSYIPLKKSILNKRKRKKLQGEFDGLVRAAKRGTSKGKPKRRK